MNYWIKKVLFVLGLTASIACSQVNIDALEEKKGRKQMTTEWRVGRFQFVLPDNFLQTGQSQSIYNVNLLATTVSQGSPKQQWQAKIQALNAKSGTQFSQQGLWQNGIYLAFYTKELSQEYGINALAMKSFGEVVLFADYHGKQGKEQEISKLISIVYEGYSEDAISGFAVGKGVLVSKPSINEHARISFQNNSRDIELTLSTNTVANTEIEHPMSNFPAEKESLAEEDIVLEAIKDEKIEIKTGEYFESIVSIKQPNGELSYRFTLFQQGKKGDAFQPNILVKALVNSEDYQTFNEQTWQPLMTSIQLVK